MKIRASGIYSTDVFTQLQIKEQLTNSTEDISAPCSISNNECSVGLGSETATDDSPLSFIVKYKASFTNPPGSPVGFSGFQIEDINFKNTKVDDQASKFFKSVNENHHDLELVDDIKLNQLVTQSCQSPHFFQSFDWQKVSEYLVKTINDKEWQLFYQQNKKWNKFKNRALSAKFKRKHCEFEQHAIIKYRKTAPNDFEADLLLLKQHEAISDANHLSMLRSLFPHIF